MADAKTNTKLEDLGFDDFFAAAQASSAYPNSLAARVIAEHRELYRVKNAKGEFAAKITGRHALHAERRADYPAVGDWVLITVADSAHAVIQAILPRKTLLKKKYADKPDAQIIAANIDVAFIIESLDRDFNLNRFERYIVLAREGGSTPVIVLNKTDAVPEAEVRRRSDEIRGRFEGVEAIATSAVTERGLDALTWYIQKGKTYCFLGSSGVGKSSLINKLLKKDIIKTQEIGSAAERGKHTTTAREMYFLEQGGIVIDNPGTREVGMADVRDGIEQVFGDITSLSNACKYADCTHTHEPGCVVSDAVESGNIDREKYQNYLKLKKEDEFYAMTSAEKREKDRKFGKFIKKAIEQVKDIKGQ